MVKPKPYEYNLNDFKSILADLEMDCVCDPDDVTAGKVNELWEYGEVLSERRIPWEFDLTDCKAWIRIMTWSLDNQHLDLKFDPYVELMETAAYIGEFV